MHISTVTEAVRKEMEDPGKFLGYRNLNLKLRTEHGIRVPRQVVHDVIVGYQPTSILHFISFSFQIFKEGGPSASADFQGALRLHYNIILIKKKKT